MHYVQVENVSIKKVDDPMQAGAALFLTNIESLNVVEMSGKNCSSTNDGSVLLVRYANEISIEDSIFTGNTAVESGLAYVRPAGGAVGLSGMVITFGDEDMTVNVIE